MSRIISNNKQSFNILVAEDDSFQRLALVDILGLCSFEGYLIHNIYFIKKKYNNLLS